MNMKKREHKLTILLISDANNVQLYLTMIKCDFFLKQDWLTKKEKHGLEILLASNASNE